MPTRCTSRAWARISFALHQYHFPADSTILRSFCTQQTDLHPKNGFIESEENGVEFGCQFMAEDSPEEIEFHGSADCLCTEAGRDGYAD